MGKRIWVWLGSRQGETAVLLLVLLAAAAIRLIGLYHFSPPGLEHDEVANWLIDRSILDEGNWAVYYTAAYGHEAGFHYLQALFVALVGDNALSLRLPAAFAGLLVVAVAFALGRELFDRRVALFVATITAVLFWSVFYSRLGLRAITLPVLSGLSAWFWWRGWKSGSQENGRWLLSGFLAGLSLHTYMAARAVPIFYGAWFIYLAICHRNALWQRRQSLLLFWVALGLTAWPLVNYLLTHPGAEFRISEVDAPLRAMLAGDLRPVLVNSWRIIGMFGWQGDPLWRQNVAFKPVFEPVLALLFYGGVLVSLWRWRNAPYMFGLLWLACSAIPSIVTINAPSTIRIINALPILGVFPAAVIHNLLDLSTVWDKFSTKINRNMRNVVWIMSALAVLGGYGVRTAQDIFVVWPQGGDVPFVWQQALTETAVYLDGLPDPGVVAIGGWTPDTMDPPTMQLSLRREDLSLRYFHPSRAVLIPHAAAGEVVRLFRPSILPMDAWLEARLQAWGAEVVPMGSFTMYVLPVGVVPQPQVTYQVQFGDELRLVGYDMPEKCVLGETAVCPVYTYWQVNRPVTSPRRLFLHLVDGAGQVVAQHDGLDAPGAYWQTGDWLIQRHELNLTSVPQTAESLRLRLGVYNPDTCPACENLLADTGEPFVWLTAVFP